MTQAEILEKASKLGHTKIATTYFEAANKLQKASDYYRESVSALLSLPLVNRNNDLLKFESNKVHDKAKFLKQQAHAVLVFS